LKIIQFENAPPCARCNFCCTGTRIRTLIKGFGDLYSTIELCPYTSTLKGLLKELLIRTKVPGQAAQVLCKFMKTVPKVLPPGGFRRALLFQYLRNLSRSNCTSAFTNCKFQTLLHCNRLDQFYGKVRVITRHYHFSSCR
jgi:hypothetical protein